MVKLDCKYCKIVNKKINYIYFFIVLKISIQITNTELDDLHSSSNNNKGDVYSAVGFLSWSLQQPHKFIKNL